MQLSVAKPGRFSWILNW